MSINENIKVAERYFLNVHICLFWKWQSTVKRRELANVANTSDLTDEWALSKQGVFWEACPTCFGKRRDGDSHTFDHLGRHHKINSWDRWKSGWKLYGQVCHLITWQKRHLWDEKGRTQAKPQGYLRKWTLIKPPLPGLPLSLISSQNIYTMKIDTMSFLQHNKVLPCP